MRRTVPLVACFVAGLVASWSGAAIAQESDNGWVVIEPLRGRKPPIDFNHRNHVNLVRPVANGKCFSCHHRSSVDNNEWHCVSCHGTSDLGIEGDSPDFQSAIHSLCKECHRAQRRGPLLCRECHIQGGDKVRDIGEPISDPIRGPVRN